MRIVRLEWYEVLGGSTIGLHRQIEAMRIHPQSERRYTADRWGRDVESALAEVAVAKSLGIYWNMSVNTGKAPDVGRYQVRHTERQDGKLIIRPRDADDGIYILVTGQAPDYQIHGWIVGSAGKSVGKPWNPDGKEPAYWVDRGRLNSIENLLSYMSEVVDARKGNRT